MAAGHQNRERQGWLAAVFHRGDKARRDGCRRSGQYFRRVDRAVQFGRRRQADAGWPELPAEVDQEVASLRNGDSSVTLQERQRPLIEFGDMFVDWRVRAFFEDDEF